MSIWSKLCIYFYVWLMFRLGYLTYLCHYLVCFVSFDMVHWFDLLCCSVFRNPGTIVVCCTCFSGATPARCSFICFFIWSILFSYSLLTLFCIFLVHVPYVMQLCLIRSKLIVYAVLCFYNGFDEWSEMKINKSISSRATVVWCTYFLEGVTAIITLSIHYSVLTLL